YSGPAHSRLCSRCLDSAIPSMRPRRFSNRADRIAVAGPAVGGTPRRRPDRRVVRSKATAGASRDSPPPGGVAQLREMDHFDLRLLVDRPLEARSGVLAERRAMAKARDLERRGYRFRGVVALDVAHRVPLPQPVVTLGE